MPYSEVTSMVPFRFREFTVNSVSAKVDPSTPEILVPGLNTGGCVLAFYLSTDNFVNLILSYHEHR